MTGPAGPNRVNGPVFPFPRRAGMGYNADGRPLRPKGAKRIMPEMWKKIATALGLSPTWWQWRWRNFKQRFAARFRMDGNAVRHLRSRQKICPRCGALAGAEAVRCAVCGARLPSALRNFFQKSFGLILPGLSPATAAVAAVIAVDFLFQVVASKGAGLLSPRLETLLRAGALDSLLVAAGQWWRLLTCVFVHIGIIHLAFNMYALLSVSSFLESEIGSARYLSLFLFSGLGGSAASFLLHARVVSAGASGAIFGLIGFAISYFRRRGGSGAAEIRAFMVRWALYAFVFGLLVRADNAAHAGGFAAGFLIGSIMEIREDDRRRLAPLWRGIALGLSAAAALGFLLLIRSR
jgi:rhomboid protease GluP